MNLPLKAFLVLLCLCMNELFLHALPEGTVSLQGGGSFMVTEKSMVIEAPDGSVFEHQSFDLAADESVRFNQPTNQSFRSIVKEFCRAGCSAFSLFQKVFN